MLDFLVKLYKCINACIYCRNIGCYICHSPRADVQYSLHALTRPLAKTRNWTVALKTLALKTLIVIHRALREDDPAFTEELLNFQHRGRVLQLATFKDDSSPIAWDCSARVRTYGLFLEELINRIDLFI
ncbi:putative ANTH domain, ENTH domain-containing protein [Helianthus annuus]|nr:putative ANTH domain, ENTH domain-containing protein [Helianthus annuus]